MTKREAKTFIQRKVNNYFMHVSPAMKARFLREAVEVAHEHALELPESVKHVYYVKFLQLAKTKGLELFV